MQLLPGEQVVLSSDGDVVVLTTHRIRMHSVVWGQALIVSMTLDSVASCRYSTESNTKLLIAAIVIGIIGLSGPGSGLLLGISGMLLIAYWMFSLVYISITSNGGSVLRIPARGLSQEDVVAFIDAVEREKLRHRKERISG